MVEKSKLVYLRLAQSEDLVAIQAIIEGAKQVLAKNNIDQWQEGEPNVDAIKQDLELQQCYVLMLDHVAVATAVLQEDPEPTYDGISSGSWCSSDSYATIHRVAVDPNYRGQHLSSFLFSNLVTLGYNKGLRNFRIDTHPDNSTMQHVITNQGFAYRGVISLDNSRSPERFCYELNLI